jgi:hypothetical protein
MDYIPQRKNFQGQLQTPQSVAAHFFSLITIRVDAVQSL